MKFTRFVLKILALGAISGLLYFHYMGNSIEPTVAPELEVYANEWKNDMDSAGISYNWNMLDHIKYVDEIPSDIFGDGDPNRAGFSDQSTRTVYIRKTNNYQPIHVKVILYHELSHYMFNCRHMGKGEILGENLIEDPGHYNNNWSILISNYINHIKDE